MGHSFGGFSLPISNLTRLSELIKGFIDVDGSHNYPLNDTLTREALLKEGIIRFHRKEISTIGHL